MSIQLQEGIVLNGNDGDDKLTTGIDVSLPVDEHVEEVHEDGKRVRRRGVYLLPNLVTTGAMFAGFFAIVAAMNGRFEASAIAIFMAGILDILDGRVARLTNTQSAFGMEYDSLSDMVSFGVAPALVMFSWTLSSLGKLGWACAFVYVACAALRLARYNTQIASSDKRYFSGLASPAAAGFLASMVWTFTEAGFVGAEIPVALSAIAALFTALTGALMVLNLPYHSFKDVDAPGRVPFAMILLSVLIIGIVTIDPPIVLLLVGTIYALSGPAQFCWTHLKAAQADS